MTAGRENRDRGQSHVVGVVLLLALTAVALGGLTAAVGGVVDEQTARADAAGVAADLDAAIRPVETTGVRRSHVDFADGRLGVEGRELRILNESGVVAVVRTDALVWRGGDHRVAVVDGAVVRGTTGRAWFDRDPPITSGPGVLIVGAARLNGSGSVAGGDVTARVRTTVSHDRVRLGNGTYRVAVETTTPGPFERYAERIGATATRRSFDDDGVDSVVLAFDGQREAYLVVHDLRLEVDRG